MTFGSLSPPYDIVLADPPWRFTSNSRERPGRNALRHYSCMSPGEIAALPVREIAARDALLYLWVTVPHLATGLDVLRAWGFRYVSGLVWVKARIGTGFWVRNRHEIVLIARRGRFPCPRPAPHPDSVIEAPQREHSRKPDALHEMIEDAFPSARRVELFARQRRPGWHAWGNETAKFGAAA